MGQEGRSRFRVQQRKCHGLSLGVGWLRFGSECGIVGKARNWYGIENDMMEPQFVVPYLNLFLGEQKK